MSFGEAWRTRGVGRTAVVVRWRQYQGGLGDAGEGEGDEQWGVVLAVC